jgi:hypothetical protein
MNKIWLVFDFELFIIGGRYNLLRNIGALFAESDEQGTYTNVDPVLRYAVYQKSVKELDPMG